MSVLAARKDVWCPLMLPPSQFSGPEAYAGAGIVGAIDGCAMEYATTVGGGIIGGAATNLIPRLPAFRSHCGAVRRFAIHACFELGDCCDHCCTGAVTCGYETLSASISGMDTFALKACFRQPVAS